ncbi:MAG TPA: CDP-alcohol phosphatidyltransferase family protein [Pseudonocardiaceae bacterium]|jgi:cardiolipin synthase
MPRGDDTQDAVHAAGPDRVLTVPNALSALRLAGVPLFLWLLLGPQHDGWAIVVLTAGGISDWLDGKLARWLNQSSRLGALLDPLVDRLYILATLLAFGVRAIVPWWVIGVLVGRDLVLAATLPVWRRYGMTAPEVHYLGKAATFNLLYAFPILLLAQGESTAAQIARPIGTAFAVWGGVLYVWSAVLYLVQLVATVRVNEARRA